MMERRLQAQLFALAQRQRRVRLTRSLTVCWAAAAATGLVLFLLTNQATSNYLWTLPLILGLALAAIVLLRQPGPSNEILNLIHELEPHHPELRHLLATAAEQKPSAASGEFGFLQLRVIEEVLAHPRHTVWRQQLKQRFALAQTSQAVALLALAASVLVLKHGAIPGASFAVPFLTKGMTVTPGDTQVERGTGLVISVRFGDAPPAEATLVMNSETGKESRLPMARRLADPVFGASVPEIIEPGIYHIEYAGKKTRDYKITVFEFPALVRADAELRYPAYTGLTNRTFRDALRVSAVEGSRLSYTMQLNKPVVRARLVGKDESLALAMPSNAVAVLPEFLLTNSARFSLELVDADGRANKFASDFFFQALTNQRPNVKLVFPRGDPRVSPLEELQLSAEASDDFGLLKYGIGYGIAGQDPQFVELGQTAPANVKKQFSHLISLEKLGVEVEQAVAYFAWADDYGPDGQVRRTFSDMFFAEVRPFEEIYRPDQSGSSGGGSQGSGQGGNERLRLADLQKQIVVATWNLQREKTGAGGAPHK